MCRFGSGFGGSEFAALACRVQVEARWLHWVLAWVGLWDFGLRLGSLGFT